MCKYVKRFGLSRAHKVYHLSYIKNAGKQSLLWPCPGSEIKSRSKWKVCCTSTMIVQLIGTKYVQICEAVWAESRTQSTTPIRDGLRDARTDTRTDARTWILCPIRPMGDKKVNWKAIYDLLYVFHTNFDHMMYHLWNTTPWKVCDLDLTFKCNKRSKVTRSTERSYLTLYNFMYFIQTFVTACTVSEILA